MRATRYCLTLTVLVFFLCGAAMLQAQENVEPAIPAPVEQEPDLEELKEIDRPEWADKQPAASPEAGKDVEVKDANYWFNRGLLLSVYGNEKAAIGAFQQATIMAPQWSSPYFQMGVAFGENGQYAEALDAINKAIELDAGKGVYYYGRGRVHLLFGDTFNARADFEKAADLGDKDAIRYLNRQAP